MPTTAGIQLRIDVDRAPDESTYSNGVRFDGGEITIREVVFDGDRADASSVSIGHEETVTFDLATGLPLDGSGAIEWPVGAYSDVGLGVELFDDGPAPALIATGTYETDNGVARPLRFEFNSGEVFEAEASAADVEPCTSAIAKVTIAPAQWFAGVSSERLDRARVTTEGVIVISEGSNEEIFDTVAEALDRSTDASFL